MKRTFAFTILMISLILSSLLYPSNEFYLSNISKYRSKIVKVIIIEPNWLNQDENLIKQIKNLIEITPNYDILAPISIARSLDALYKTGYFKKIYVLARKSYDGVALIFYFEKRKIIQSIEFIDLPKALEKRVKNILNIKEGRVFDEQKIDSDIKSLKEILKRAGYEDCKVNYELDDLSRGNVRLKLNFLMGKPLKINNLVYSYKRKINYNIKLNIEKMLEIKNGEILDIEEINKRVRNIEDMLVKKGYVGSKIYYSIKRIDGKRADILIECDAGEKPIVRIIGDRISKKWIEKLVSIKKDQYISEALLEEYANNLHDYVNMKGYSRVDVKYSYDKANSIITFYIKKDGRYKNVKIIWEGNKYFSDAELDKLNLFKHWYIEDLVNEQLKKVELFYNDYGFKEAKAKLSKIEVLSNQLLRITISIQENEQTLIKRVNIFGVSAFQEDYIKARMSVFKNQYLSLKRLEDDIQLLESDYINLGYPNIKIKYSLVSKPESNNVIVNINVDEGNRYYIDRIFLRGNYATKASFINRYLDVKPDELFSYDKILSSQMKLYELEIFDRVDFEYATLGWKSSSQIDIMLDLDESSKYSLSYGIGYQQEDKIRGFISLVRKNMLGTGIRGELLLRYGFIEKRLFASLRQPNFLNLPLHSLITGTYEHQSRESFTYNGRIITFQLDLPIDKSTDYLIEYRFNNTDLKVKEEIAEITIDPRYRTVNASSIAGIFVQDKRDNPLEPQKGYFYSTSLEYASKALKSEQEFLKFYSQFQFYYGVFDLFTIAISSRLGMIESFREDGFVPINFRFFAGGSKTFRGAELDKLGPVYNGIPLGGKGLFVNNIEFRIPIYGNFSIVAFYDVGNVFRKVSYIINGSDYDHAIGIGFRYSTPIGPIAFDIGNLLKARPDEKKYLYFLSIGHSF